MRKFMTLAVVALLSGCAPDVGPPLEVVAHAQQRRFLEQRCGRSDDFNACATRETQQALAAGLAADAQCKFAAQQAYMQVDISRPSLLGLEATGYRNMTYRSCMQAYGRSIPGGSGGPAPTLADVFN